MKVLNAFCHLDAHSLPERQVHLVCLQQVCRPPRQGVPQALVAAVQAGLVVVIQDLTRGKKYSKPFVVKAWHE